MVIVIVAIPMWASAVLNRLSGNNILVSNYPDLYRNIRQSVKIGKKVTIFDTRVYILFSKEKNKGYS